MPINVHGRTKKEVLYTKKRAYKAAYHPLCKIKGETGKIQTVANFRESAQKK